MSSKLPKPERVNTPIVLQMEASECGAACLTILLSYHGHITSLESVRNHCHVSRDGCRAFDIIDAAEKYHLELDAYEIDIESFDEIELPCILYWSFNHFVVLEGWEKDKVYINDPGQGKVTLPLERFRQEFTGIVIMGEPVEGFTKEKTTQSFSKMIHDRLKGSYKDVSFLILFGILLAVPTILMQAIIRALVDDVLIGQTLSTANPVIIAAVGLLIIQIGMYWIQQNQLLKLELKLILTTEAQFVWRLLYLPIRFFEQRFTGDIESRIEENDRVGQMITNGMSESMLNIISVMVFSLILFAIQPILAAFMMLLNVINALIFFSTAEKIKAYNLAHLQESGKLFAFEMNTIMAIQTIKVNLLQNDFIQRWSQQHRRKVQHQNEVEKQSQIIKSFNKLIYDTKNLLMVLVGFYLIGQGMFSVGAFLAFQLVSIRIDGPIQALIEMSKEIQMLRGDLARIHDVLDYPEPIEDRSEKVKPEPESSIEIKDLTFGYNHFDPPIIDKFNLTVNPGEHIAIVGKNGQGKSTIIKLLTGLYEPIEGEILVGGIPHSKLDYKGLYILVDHTPKIFAGSLLDNLTMWKEEVDLKLVDRAIAIAELSEMVQKRGGLYCECTEGGSNFSGGQKQQIEIARAIIHQPQVLIFDEATSAMDPITEHKIISNLQSFKNTVIFVTHRLSAIRDCDKIIVIKTGEILETGTHDELLQQGGMYAELMNWESEA